MSTFVSQMKNIKLPVHYGIKCFHCIQVCVAVVTSHCKNSPHQCCDADSTPWSCKLCNVLPLVAAWVKAFHRAEWRVVIEATCKESSCTRIWPLGGGSDIPGLHYRGFLSIEWASVQVCVFIWFLKCPKNQSSSSLCCHLTHITLMLFLKLTLEELFLSFAPWICIACSYNEMASNLEWKKKR